MGAGAFVCMCLHRVWLLTTVSSLPYHWGVARGSRAVLGVLSILFYVMMVIGVKRESLNELMMPNLIIWPDWAWWFAILVAALWGLTAGFASRGTIRPFRNPALPSFSSPSSTLLHPCRHV